MNLLRDQHGVTAISEALGRSRSGIYKARERDEHPSARAQANDQLLDGIREIHRVHKGRYGSPRMVVELRRQGYSCGVNRVSELMRKNGIAGVTSRRKAPRTTDSRHGGLIAPNLLKKLKTQGITRPNQVWVMDITYIRVSSGFVYLATVLDLFTHQIVGWQIAEHMRAELAVDALRQAIALRRPPKGLVIHSDRGSQYSSKMMVKLAKKMKFKRSMSAKGNCYDNAAMESFFGVLKREELDRLKFTSLEEARAITFAYIEAYYNTRRIHTAIGMPPDEFAAAWHLANPAPAAEFAEHGGTT